MCHRLTFQNPSCPFPGHALYWEPTLQCHVAHPGRAGTVGAVPAPQAPFMLLIPMAPISWRKKSGLSGYSWGFGSGCELFVTSSGSMASLRLVLVPGTVEIPVHRHKWGGYCSLAGVDVHSSIPQKGIGSQKERYGSERSHLPVH